MSNTLNFGVTHRQGDQGVETPHAITGEDPDVNSNQEIDTKYEAENVLSFMSGNDFVSAGGKTYSRAELMTIRDRNSAATTQTPPSTTTVAGEGASHGFFISGFGGGGLGYGGHAGGGGRMGYRGGISLLGGEGLRLHLDPSVGAQVEHRQAGYTTPGGEPIASGFTGGGLLLGADLRIVPNVIEHRFSGIVGLRIAIGGFGTAETTSVALPPTCTPDEFGRGECEPNAGPRTGNAGTTGLQNFDLSAARGTSGVYLSAGGALGVGIEFFRGDWGNIRAQAMFEAGYVYLAPSDGHAFGFPSLAGTLDLSINVGGNAVERAAKADEPTVQTETLSEQPAAGETWNLDPVLAAHLPANAQIRGVAFDGQALSGPPYSVPANRMTAGAHTLRITYRMPGEAQDRIQELAITVAAPVTQAPNGGGFIGIDHTEEIFRKRTQN